MMAQEKPTLKIDERSRSVTLKAQGVPVHEIIRELSRTHKISFGLSRAVSVYEPVLDLKHASLETVLKSLAPFVILEEELAGGGDKPEITKAYLFGYNEDMPKISDPDPRSSSRSQVLAFEGNTEVTEESKNADALDIFVRVANDKLTLRCRDQPALWVAGRIAEELKVPLMTGQISNPSITADFADLPIEKAFSKFPRVMRLKFLLDLTTMKAKYTQLVLDENK
jgi:hypothetical protein